MDFPSFDLGDENMAFVEENLLFNSDDIDDLLLTIDPTDIQNELPDVSALTADTDINSTNDETETHDDVENIQTTPKPPSEHDQTTPKPPSEHDQSDDENNKFDIAEDNLRDFVQGNRNRNTTIKTKRETARFKKYLEEKEEEKRDIHEIPPNELNIYLGGFLKDLKKKNGDDYEPDSVTSFFR